MLYLNYLSNALRFSNITYIGFYILCGRSILLFFLQPYIVSLGENVSIVLLLSPHNANNNKIHVINIISKEGEE